MNDAVLTRRRDEVLLITLNRPEARNAITEAEFWLVQQRHNETIFNSGDAREGARAFAEKRPPEWSGT